MASSVTSPLVVSTAERVTLPVVTGVGRVLAWVAEALSILTSKGAINGPWGALKLPLQTVRPTCPDDTPTDPQRRIGGVP